MRGNFPHLSKSQYNPPPTQKQTYFSFDRTEVTTISLAVGFTFGMLCCAMFMVWAYVYPRSHQTFNENNRKKVLDEFRFVPGFIGSGQNLRVEVLNVYQAAEKCKELGGV